MNNLFKKLYNLQSSKPDVFVKMYGSDGYRQYNKLHYKCNGNIILFYLHSNSEDNKILIEYLTK